MSFEISGASIAVFPLNKVISVEVEKPYGYIKGTQTKVLFPLRFFTLLEFFKYVPAAKIFSFVSTTDFGLPVEPLVNNINASSFLEFDGNPFF